jgi:hypothetical protein
MYTVYAALFIRFCQLVQHVDNEFYLYLCRTVSGITLIYAAYAAYFR